MGVSEVVIGPADRRRAQRGRSMGAGHSRQSRDFLHVHNSRRPLGWRAGRTPGICGAERGVYGVEHAAGTQSGAGIAIPCANPHLSEPGFWSASACIPRPGGGGGWRHDLGRTPGMCGAERGGYGVEGPAGGRRARRERPRGQRAALSCAGPRLSEPGFGGAGRFAFARGPGAGGKGGAHPGYICGTARGGEGV